MKFIDTNIILRFLLNDHPTQSSQVIAMIEAARPDSFLVADVTIFEAAWIMQGPGYAMSRQSVADKLMFLTKVDQIRCNSQLLQRILSDYVKYPSISLIDLALAVYAEINQATPLLTYDKKLARALPKLVQEVK